MCQDFHQASPIPASRERHGRLLTVTNTYLFVTCLEYRCRKYMTETKAKVPCNLMRGLHKQHKPLKWDYFHDSLLYINTLSEKN